MNLEKKTQLNIYSELSLSEYAPKRAKPPILVFGAATTFFFIKLFKIFFLLAWLSD